MCIGVIVSKEAREREMEGDGEERGGGGEEEEREEEDGLGSVLQEVA